MREIPYLAPISAATRRAAFCFGLYWLRALRCTVYARLYVSIGLPAAGAGWCYGHQIGHFLGCLDAAGGRWFIAVQQKQRSANNRINVDFMVCPGSSFLVRCNMHFFVFWKKHKKSGQLPASIFLLVGWLSGAEIARNVVPNDRALR